MFKNYFYVLFCILFFNFGFSQVGTYQIVATSPVPSTFTTLQDAINTIGNGTSTLHINNNLTVNSNLVVPKNLSLKFYNGSIITINNGVTLTINGQWMLGIFKYSIVLEVEK
ncbi:hypothetical protein [Flavobacterium kingsejongi]|uniref:Uncharacterized protein n=1 Tax=Flavobacterium kingsejongi TaxID=1678728 RepID=A0A2S1LPU3_9FLAO|nr:hypothetical protein [Flavobacterium kingsejongi]AWG25773.1 hypothetical protein FK004_11345 [Flavobacterium kingsejongi]